MIHQYTQESCNGYSMRGGGGEEGERKGKGEGLERRERGRREGAVVGMVSMVVLRVKRAGDSNNTSEVLTSCNTNTV